ncbi:MAG: TIGR03905 family TSCPD domain-containing protein [Clostridiales bacterium]|nr:TIGR03905 family TSCPD domain-containing protein [Clostridiales bacterium]
MEYHFTPKGVCSTRFHAEVDEEGRVGSLTIENGCNGNGKGIGSLVRGMSVDEIIERLDGIKCGRKNTSCPDQIAKMMAEIKREMSAAG